MYLGRLGYAEVVMVGISLGALALAPTFCSNVGLPLLPRWQQIWSSHSSPDRRKASKYRRRSSSRTYTAISTVSSERSGSKRFKF